MKNTTNNKLSKIAGLPLTGAALIAFAAINAGILICDKIVPMINGSFQAEILPGVEGGVMTAMMVVFGIASAVFLLSYLLMALLGVNALRVFKNPEGVKARTGLAKFLIFIGVVSLLSSIVSPAESASVMDTLSLVLPAVAHIAFVASYLVDVKKFKNETQVIAE